MAWLLIQAASIILPTYEAPAWTMKVLIAALAVGFPIAVVLAWAFEITPEGIKRAEDVSPSESIKSRRGRKLIAVTIVLACVAAGLLVFRLVGTNRRAVRSEDSTDGRRSAASLPVPDKSIAVLPFENLSDDKQNAYFADGIQDEILTKLASIADLKVISRTSTAKYKSKPETLKTVSQELGVATVLEGTVQKAGDKVRVNVQLIDARVDSHLWAKSYDGDAKDIFGVESEVSQQIADALRAKLSPREASLLAKAPTQDAEAYDLFLKGEFEQREGEIRVSVDFFDRAAGYYRQALARDQNFALAAAHLAVSRLSHHWYSTTPLSPPELDEVKSMVDRAVTLAPDLAEVRLALGFYYYWGHRQYELALVEFGRAVELQPNNARAQSMCGFIYRRQGSWARSLAAIARAEELDPRDAVIQANQALSYCALRQWADGRRAASRALAIDPQSIAALRMLFLSYLNGEGDIKGAEHVLASLAPGTKTVGSHRGVFYTVVDAVALIRVLRRDFEGALKEWEKEAANNDERMTRLSARAAIRVIAGTINQGKGEAEEARLLLETKLGQDPNDAAAMTRLSWIYLALDRPADALRLAQQAAESLPIEKDAVVGPEYAAGLAEIQARAGHPQEAVKILRRLLSIPVGDSISLKRLQIDPLWDPIRNEPEFQQLLGGKEQIGPNK